MHIENIKVPPSTSEQDAIKRIRETLTAGAVAVGRGFTDPDDDWQPIWMIVLAKGQGGIIVSGDLHKHEMAKRVGELARKHGAVAIGHLHSSWMIDTEGLSVERARAIMARVSVDGSTEGIPERVEGLTMVICTAMSWCQMWAPIMRFDDRPPQLEPFRTICDSGEKDAQLGGAMVDPLQRALLRIG